VTSSAGEWASLVLKFFVACRASTKIELSPVAAEIHAL
jgi:hypothetical protein